MKKDYDIVIIGAGPAGSTLARLLDKKYSILLLDRRELDKEKSKSKKNCGGLLSPDAQKALASLKLGVPKRVLVGPQLFTVRVLDFDNNSEGFYQRNYVNIDREKFDRWLSNLIDTKVDKLFNTHYKSSKKYSNITEVTIKYKNKNIKIKTKLLVGADGANSKIRKEYFSNKPFPEKYVSIQEWFYSKNITPYYSAIFDLDISDFYSWIIPKEDSLIVGSAIKYDKNIRKNHNLLIKKLKEYGYDIDKPYKKRGAFIYRTMRPEQIVLGNKNVVLIGEAAGLISPTSAEGISYALRSAKFLAKSLNEDKDFFKGYKKRVKPLKRDLLLKNMKYPIMYNKKLRNIVIKSKLLSMDL